MNLLQFIEYKSSLHISYNSFTGRTEQYKDYVFIYIDKNGQIYDGLSTRISLETANDPDIEENYIKEYLRNIHLDKYKDMIYQQEYAKNNAK